MKTGHVAATAVVALVALVWTQAAAADDAALRQEVSVLKQMVLDLQARVAHLEGQTTAAPQAAAAVPEPAAPVPQTVPPVAQSQPPPVAPVAPPTAAAGSGYVSEEAALRANWAKVAKEMDEGEVTALLGEPSSKSTLDGRAVWYYLYPGTGRGSVFFTDAGRVSSRQSPFGWGW